jgi:hypothetical protein
MSEAEVSAPSNNEAFYNLLYAFVEGLSETFEECDALRAKCTMMSAFVTQSFAWDAAADEWRKYMTPENLKLIHKKDARIFVQVLDKHPFLSDIRFSEKWLDTGLSNESRETVWWYLKELAEKSLGSTASAPETVPSASTTDKKPTKRKNMKKKKKTLTQNAQEEMKLIAKRFCEKYGIKFDEESGDVSFNFKRILNSDAVSDPDMAIIREHLGL